MTSRGWIHQHQLHRSGPNPFLQLLRAQERANWFLSKSNHSSDLLDESHVVQKRMDTVQY